MATITAFTAARMQEIEGLTIDSASVVGGELILQRRNGTSLNVGAIDGVPGANGANGLGVVFLDAAESSVGVPNGTKICRRYA